MAIPAGVPGVDTLGKEDGGPYTVWTYSFWSRPMRFVYRQNYRPQPAVWLPRWALGLWRWL